MSDGSATDVRLGDLLHVDGRLDPGGLTELFKGVLKGQGVDRRGEHAHVVGLGPVHAGASAGHAAPDVAAADDHGDIDVELGADVRDVLGDPPDDLTVDAVSGLAGECFAGNLEDDPVPAGRDPVAAGHLRPPSRPG